MSPPALVARFAAGHGDDHATLALAAVSVADDISDVLAGGSEDRWRHAVTEQAPALLTLQHEAATQAEPYLDAVLDAQGADPRADAAVNADAFVDMTDGGGSWLRNLISAPPSAYRDAISAGAGASLAASRARYVALAVTMDGIRDIARSADLTAMATRPSVRGYVRALRGKSCARCAILAGRRYKVSAFRRHPRCDCYMIPAAENVPGDWTTDPRGYFRRLSAEEQDAIFGADAAEAIRRGADISQVVNAYQGVTAVGGFRATTTGTTSRGLAGQRLKGAPRLLPDEIFQLAEQGGWSREETLRELSRNGYVI